MQVTEIRILLDGRINYCNLGQKEYLMQAALTLVAQENRQVLPDNSLITDIRVWTRRQGDTEALNEKDVLPGLVILPDTLPKLMSADYFASMCHEIRNPLGAIIGLSALLSDPKCSNERRIECAAMLSDSSSMLMELLNNLLDSSKLDASMMQMEHVCFDMQRVIQEAIHIIGVKANEKGLKLKVHIGDGLPPELRGDPLRIRQILLNLLGNAIKFTDTGMISVHVDARSGLNGGYEVRIIITDSGRGIGKEALARIFDKFTQADASVSRQFGGTGLGLAISQDLARMMSGNITVESYLGRGSHFIVTLPFPGAAVMAA